MAGNFERLNCIGSGNFGSAWLVRCTANDRKYVLKDVRVQGLTNKEIEQAVTEVKVLSQCYHFNIIKYKQAFVHNSALNIVMEYANGGDLQSKIQMAGRNYFEEQIVISWFVQITFALKYLHKNNIMHRDLKTQNIFLTHENIVKVGDFGISKILSSGSGHAETAIGTPYYLSPEICQSKPYDKKSDIWALGCILYEMATLEHAFKGPSFNTLVFNIVHGNYGPLPSHYTRHPISHLIELTLQHDSADRPTADQILHVPSLISHITTYETYAIKLMKAAQQRREAFRGRKHSLSEIADSGQPKVQIKRRSHSLDSRRRIESKCCLRKAVILKQAFTRQSGEINTETYTLTSPEASNTNADMNNDSKHLDDDDDDVFDDATVRPGSKDLDVQQVYKQALLAAKESSALATELIRKYLEDIIGAKQLAELEVVVYDHMNSRPHQLNNHKLEVGECEKLVHLVMLMWFLED